MATISDKVRERILKFLKLDKLEGNPNNVRFTFINDDEALRLLRAKEGKVWYYGDSSELDNFYRDENISDFPANPIYTENMRQYFRAKSIKECGVKKVHSGVAHAVIESLVNAVGVPTCGSENDIVNREIDEIICENELNNILNQRQIPLTLAEGWGAYKVNFDKGISNNPIIQYYEAMDVEFACKYNRVVGIVYKDYYKYKGKDYVLLETRRIANGDSIIEYELFRLEKSNQVEPVDLYSIPELQVLPKEGYVIKGLNKILGVPCKIFYDAFNKNYGRSIFTGKIDLLDDLDQILSQESQTVRVSTPVEYYKVDALKRGRNGEVCLPNLFNRQYVEAPDGIPNGDGITGGKQIETTQPVLNFNQYSEEAKAKLDFILTGLLSPATLGIDVAKKDNADAQREKEKITLMTRNNIIDRETSIIKELLNLCLCVKEYLTTGKITIQDYDISVKFDKFATPSLEQKLIIWGNAYNSGIASEEKVVEGIYGDSLSDEEKQFEIDFIKNKAKADNMNFGDLNLNEETTIGDSEQER